MRPIVQLKLTRDPSLFPTKADGSIDWDVRYTGVLPATDPDNWICTGYYNFYECDYRDARVYENALFKGVVIAKNIVDDLKVMYWEDESEIDCRLLASWILSMQDPGWDTPIVRFKREG